MIESRLDPSPPPAVGARFADRFMITRRVEVGPGHVELRAVDDTLAAEIALWWLRPGLHGLTGRDTVMGEAARLRRLQHPAVRTLLDVGEHGEQVWATYQLADRGPQPQPGRSMPYEQVAAWMRTVAGALHAGHAAGVVHGRMTPRDVVLVGGRLRVGGIGLWMDVETEPAALAWRGHDAFIAPEVRDGAVPGPEADAWSLAASACAYLIGAPDGGLDPERAVAAHHPNLAMALAAALVHDPGRRCGVIELMAYVDEALGTRAPPASGRGTLLGAASRAGGAGPGPAAPASAAPSVEQVPPVARPPVTPEPWVATPPPGQRGSQPVMAPGPVDPSLAPPPGGPARRPSTGGEGVRPSDPDLGGAFSADEVTGAINRARAVGPGLFQAVSMRPGGEAPERDDVDDTDRRVRIRPLAEAMPRKFPVSPGALGYIAPPRQVSEARDRRRRVVLIVVVAAVVIVGGVIALILASRGGARAGSTGSGGSGSAAPGRGGSAAPRGSAAPGTSGSGAPGGAASYRGGSPSAPPPVPAAAPARGCTDAMRPLGDACIDAHESPGPDRLPDTEVTLADAAARCAARNLRLCTAAEWRAACAGPDGARWPYGAAFETGACNVAGRVIARTGSSPACVSAAGVHDMSGNVAEWVADGTILGGSALDVGDGRCDGAPRTVPLDARLGDVGFRCCGDR